MGDYTAVSNAMHEAEISQTPLRDVLAREAAADTAHLKKSEPANPKQHYGDKKLPLGLVPFSFIANTCVALYEGLRKYGLVNWRAAKVEAMTYVSAQERHVHKWVNGERCDPVTKVPHLASAAACLCILIDAELNGSLIDNRPRKCENVDTMVADLENVLDNLKVLFADKDPKHYYMKEEK